MADFVYLVAVNVFINMTAYLDQSNNFSDYSGKIIGRTYGLSFKNTLQVVISHSFP